MPNHIISKLRVNAAFLSWQTTSCEQPLKENSFHLQRWELSFSNMCPNAIKTKPFLQRWPWKCALPAPWSCWSFFATKARKSLRKFRYRLRVDWQVYTSRCGPVVFNLWISSQQLSHLRNLTRQTWCRVTLLHRMLLQPTMCTRYPVSCSWIRSASVAVVVTCLL